MGIRQQNLEKLDPRLRVICNGDDEVNALRSELSAAVQAPPAVVRQYQARTMLQQAVKKPRRREPLPAPAPDQPPADAVKVSCFVRLVDPEDDREPLPGGGTRRGDLLTAELTPRQIEEIADLGPESGIAAIETGEPLALPHPVVTPRGVTEPPSRAPASAASGRGPVSLDRTAPAVLVGIVDVGGFDFAHPDFLTPQGTTRFVRIWDQGAARGSSLGPPPLPFTDGAEITGERMNRALEWSRTHRIGATDLLRQSSQRAGAHATHVASIAAGNTGVCPDAAIAGVLIALSEEDQARHASFYDSTRLAHAVDYLFGLGERLYGRSIPTVVNISLGTNGHAHDGSSAICRWIDAALTTPGRCVCVAAGNAGQEAPQFAGDLGFLMGRIHASGQITARGLETNLEWHVVGNGIADVSENQLEIWYEASDEFEVRLRSPSGVWIGPVRPGSYVENHRLESETFVSIYSQQYNVANGANRISVILSPRLKPPVVGIEAGTWLVRVRGVEVRDGRFDAWIERDDPRPLGRVGEVDAWRFPSYFSARSNVDRSSVSSLACGHRVISVGNCDTAAERISRSSSQGPTRDGRYKPEIAAPGTDVVAARGFSPRDRLWVGMSGTSMASPYVAGVAAHMLAREPRLTATQILGIMRRTAQPLPGSDYRWQDSAGFGLIQPDACLAEAHKPFLPLDLDRNP
jgi:subtilisin family serine protease